MGTFATKKILPGNPSLIPAIAEQIRTEFMAEQFEVQIDNLLSGGVDISISKGNLFKAVLGLKSALKVSLIPKDNAIAFEAGIGIFGQQAIPTIIWILTVWYSVRTADIGISKVQSFVRNVGRHCKELKAMVLLSHRSYGI